MSEGQPKKSRSFFRIIGIAVGVLVLLCIILVGIGLLLPDEETPTPVAQEGQGEVTIGVTEPSSESLTPTDTLSPTDTPKPTTIPPTDTPPEASDLSQEELIDKWRLPFASISFVVGGCDSTLETAEKVQAGEITGLEAYGELLAAGLILSAAEEVVVDWDPPLDQNVYKPIILNHIDNIQNVLAQWVDEEVSSGEISSLLSDECEEVYESGAEIAKASQEDGVTEAGLQSILDGLEAAVDESVTESEETVPTVISNAPNGPKGDGIYTVGQEIVPGKWESTGTGHDCYWVRLDENQEILDNYLGDAGGTVTIRETDYEVSFEDCGTFTYVENLERELSPNAPEPKSDGVYTVNVEIAPGKWESTGNGDECYWARLDDKQEILDNYLGDAGGTVTIRETDYEVSFEDCGTFTYVENLERELLPNATESKSDGVYTVNVEIAPGKWESTGTGDECYWVRLDDKQNILDNYLGNAGGTVTIRETDYEVSFSDCGTWEYKGP